jgi:hypothetical protein
MTTQLDRLTSKYAQPFTMIEWYADLGQIGHETMTALQNIAAGEDLCGSHSPAYWRKQAISSRKEANAAHLINLELRDTISAKQEEIDTLHALLAELETGSVPAPNPSQEDAAASMKIIPDCPPCQVANMGMVAAERSS